MKLAASGRLPSELTLEGQDASLLLGDFLNLGAQIAVENLNRAVAFGALQSGDGQLGESRQQIQIFRSVRAGIFSSQNQKGEKVSLMSQRETDFATEEAHLPVSGIEALRRSWSSRQGIFLLQQGLDKRTTGRQFRQGRRRPQ